MLHITARPWIGTPFMRHQSVKHLGCDCIGLMTGAWRETYGDLPEEVGPYAQDEPGRQGAETLLAPLRRHLEEVDADDMHFGDVLAWRWTGGRFAQHLAIMSEGGMIHADQRFGVVETPLYPIHRLAGVFRPWPR